MQLTMENYHEGFLVDEEVVAGVALHPEKKNEYVAFMLLQSTGDTLSYETFSDPKDAIASLNQLERGWVFEKAHQGCGNANCGNGECGSC